MNTQTARPASSTNSQPRSASRLSDGAPPVIIFTGASKAFKEPAWIIRTSGKTPAHGRT